MKEKSEKKLSLYLEVAFMSLLAGVVSLLFFIGTGMVIEQQIDRYYGNKETTQSYNEKYIAKLQRFVTEEKVSVKDYDKLDKWVNDNRLIYIEIKKYDKWIYPSDYYTDEEEDNEFLTDSRDSVYNVEFSDGTAQVFITGMYSYNAYMIAMVIDIIASFMLFLLLVMLGIRRKILYINRLSHDIEILEGGNLEYEVCVEGKDEITNLAKGLNAMRISFKNQIDETGRLAKTNQDMITEISHDLRTPITAVLLYAEILQKGKCKDTEKYLDKIIKKLSHMKDLSDRMLAYSANAVTERHIPAEYMPMEGGLYDELSDMCHYLEGQGLKVKTDLVWEKGSIWVYEEYLVRILDNISSNILKYADRQADILIRNEYCQNECALFFENTCIGDGSSMDGYSIGIRNVKTMMKEMDGSCEVIEDEKMFRICLRFQYKKD